MIDTLIQDIQHLVTRKDGWFTDDLKEKFSADVGNALQSQYNLSQRKDTLRLSQMGPKCPKALWHSIHTPELAEPLPPWAEVKFSYGHIIEAQALMLARAAGHEVTGEQDVLELDGVVGHRDCVIDGHIVDVKSTSSRGFAKFKDKTLAQADDFGYLDQLDGYMVASREDPLVKVKDVGYILAIDKTLGHMVLYRHEVREDQIRARIRYYKAIVESSRAPLCECGTISDGKSGNIKLDTKASYSPFKYCCFPNLRTFLYSSGPVYLTKVVRTPDVVETYRKNLASYH